MSALNIIKYIILVVFLGFSEAFAAPVQGFPDACASASNTKAMDGHILRLGKVLPNQPSGFVFVFPDPKAPKEQKVLQAVPIADNAGLIGKLGPITLSPTLQRNFLVAQIFVGGEKLNPVVTCLSAIIPIQNYDPSQYQANYSDAPDLYLGQDFSTWLPMDRLNYWLGLDTFVLWDWNSSWSDNFRKIGPRWQQHQGDGKGHEGEKAPLTTGATAPEKQEQQGFKSTGKTFPGSQGTFKSTQSGSAGASSRHPPSRTTSSSPGGSTTSHRRSQRR